MTGLDPTTKDDHWLEKRLAISSAQCISDLQIMGKYLRAGCQNSSLKERKLAFGAGPSGHTEISVPILAHLSGTLATAHSGSSNFPGSGWKNPQNARPPGSLPGKTNLMLTPPPMEKYRQIGALQACRQMPGCPLDSPTVSADSLVLGPVLEENSSPKKAVFFKKIWNMPTI